jgi:hypothetical protein
MQAIKMKHPNTALLTKTLKGMQAIKMKHPNTALLTKTLKDTKTLLLGRGGETIIHRFSLFTGSCRI